MCLKSKFDWRRWVRVDGVWIIDPKFWCRVQICLKSQSWWVGKGWEGNCWPNLWCWVQICLKSKVKGSRWVGWELLTQILMLSQNLPKTQSWWLVKGVWKELLTQLLMLRLNLPETQSQWVRLGWGGICWVKIFLIHKVGSKIALPLQPLVPTHPQTLGFSQMWTQH